MKKIASNPRVSVVIPVYNRSKYINDSINSVLNQTYRDIEIIVCDDASTDDTLKVIDSIKSISPLPIHVEVLTENLGVSAARNKAVFLAKGELIAFLDSDDFWKPNKIEEQVSFLDKNPEYIGVGCSFEFFNGNEVKSIFKTRKEISKHNELFELLYECYITTSCFLVKKDFLILAGLFDLTLKVSEDRDLWWRLPRLGRIGFLDKVLVTYRVHNRGISKLSNWSTSKTYIPTIEKTTWFWRDRLNTREQRMILSKAQLLVAYDASDADNNYLCINHALRSLSYRCHFFEAINLILDSFVRILKKL